MAKIRHIKVEFWTSPQIVECSPLTRLLFIGMWNFCDDGGVHVYSVKRLKMEIFPADEEILSTGIEQMLNELEKNGLIKFYTVRKEKYIKVTGWRHQKNYEQFYKYPNEDGITPENVTYGRAQSKKKKKYPNKQSTDCCPSVDIPVTDGQPYDDQEGTDGQQTGHEQGNGNGKANVNENEKGDNARANTPPSEILYNFKTSNGTAKIRSDYVDELVNSYKNTDVFHELGRMNQWLNDEKSRRPTPKGLKAWIRKWLTTAQEEATADAC